MRRNKLIRLLFSVILVFAGALAIVVEAAGKTAALLTEAGQALLVAGIFSIFMDNLIESDRREDRRSLCKEIALEVHTLLSRKPVEFAGLHCVAPVREAFEGYSTWAENHDTLEHFFAGRSVLHRIDADYQNKGLGSAEQVIATRLREGASFQILFLDVTASDLIERLADEEGQRPEEMRADLAYSIGVVTRLQKLLVSEQLHPEANLAIRVSRENPWFAYHRVDDEVVVGFYFAGPMGHRSAAYEAVDTITRELFNSHFAAAWLRAEEATLLDVNSHRHRIRMNIGLLEDLKSSLNEQLGEEEAAKLLRGERKRPSGRDREPNTEQS